MTVHTSAKRPSFTPSVAIAAAALVAAASPARAGLTFTNTFDNTSAAIDADQLLAITEAESAYSNQITTNVNVNLNFVTQTVADYGFQPGDGTTSVQNSHTTSFFAPHRSALAAHATSPLDAKAVATLNASNIPVVDAYTPVSGNASNAGYAIRVNYPTNGAAPRTLNAATVLYSTAYPYYYGPVGTPTPAGEKSYTRAIASDIAFALGFVSGVDTLDYDASPTTTVLHDSPPTLNDDSVELELTADDPFRYRLVNGVPTRDAEIGDAYTYLRRRRPRRRPPRSRRAGRPTRASWPGPSGGSWSGSR